MTKPAISRASQTTGDPMMSLTDKQKVFVDALLHGQTQTMAARSAGYVQAAIEANRLMKKPKVKEALAQLHRQHERASHMTRKKVMDGMLEAISMAKAQAEPATMVNGWREIGRMCGYYAAEKKILDINITAQRAVDKLEALTDAELLNMIDEDSSVIEGEFAEVFEGANASG